MATPEIANRQVAFEDYQMVEIKKFLSIKGLYDATNNRVFDTLGQSSPEVGLFSEVYAYIYGLIEKNPAVSTETKYWFSKAAAINAGNKEDDAANFIRGVTQYGLQFRGKLTGYTQSQIDAGIQRTSNLIGQSVITEILQLGGPPIFPQMLSNDISAAIYKTLPDMQFGQDMGGWAGSFYYWNQRMNYGSTDLPKTVGDAITNGYDTQATNENPTSVHYGPSLYEFIIANAQGTVDAALKNANAIKEIPDSIYLQSLPAAIDLGMKAIKNIGQGLQTSSSAETPSNIKSQILGATLVDLVSRIWGNNFHIGPTPNPSKKTAVSYSGDTIQSAYTNGNQTVSDMGLDGSAAHGSWTVYGGGSGDLSITYNAAGAMTATMSWTTSARATATDSYNFDGSGSGKITYASGAYATYVSDSQGNVTTAEFTKNGNFISGYWIHADGSSGVETFTTSGLTNTPGSTSAFTAPLTGYELLYNRDGSYQSISIDPNDYKRTVAVDKNGAASGPVGSQGDGVNYSFSVGTGQTTTTSTGSVTRYRDAGNNLTNDTWVDNSAHTSGSDTYNASGLFTGKTLNTSDGSTDSYTLIGTPGGSTSTFTASSQVSYSVSGPYDLTRNHINSAGILVSDTWSLSDGARGTDSFSSNGSGTGNVTRSDGSTSTVALDAQGGISFTNIDAQGRLLSKDWWRADGVHGIIDYDSQGNQLDQYTFKLNGQVIVDNYNAGVISDETIGFAGAIINPDGSGFGKITNSDGSYTVAYNDSYGEFSLFQYSSGNQLKSTSHVSASREASSGFVSTFSDGTVGISKANSQTAEYTNAAGTKITLYFDNYGEQSGDDWLAADGTHGTDTFYADGSTEGDQYKADGSSVYIQDDGHGHIINTLYAANGMESGDSWIFADGRKGSDVYNADGSSSGTTFAADGSAVAYADNGRGDILSSSYTSAGVIVRTDRSYLDGSGSTTNYTSGTLFSNFQRDKYGNTTTTFFSRGIPVSDRWANIDGTHGTRVYNSDGSVTVVTYNADGTPGGSQGGTQGGNNPSQNGSSVTTANADGSYSVKATDANQNVTTKNYSASNVLVSDSWTNADGTHGNDNFNADGSSWGASYKADGSYTSYSDDAKGGVNTYSYALVQPGQTATRLTGDTWTKADGSHGAASFFVDGSSADTFAYADGSTKTDNYGADGSSSDTWTKPDGSYGYDVYNKDGSSSTSTTKADGSRRTATFNKDGSSSDTFVNADRSSGSDYYNTDGSSGDTWAKPDGTHGEDNFHADGSSAGNSYLADGSYSTYVNDGKYGSIKSKYTAERVLISKDVITGSSYVAVGNETSLTGIGSANLTLTGGAQTATITGNAGKSTLTAGSGTVTLIGGSGNDTMIGGAGNDTFVVNNVGDVVQAKSGSNINTIQTSVSYTAPANVQILTGTGSANLTLTGGAQTTTITGNAGNSTLVAGSGTVTLVGGSGNDTMVGGTGNDTFVVNNVGDVVQAKSGSNINTIQTSVSYTAPANVQVLTGTGSANLTLTGGAQTTTITGNAGNSTLVAGSGTVTLVGGTGNDTMVGGTGNDTFVVNNVGDIVQAKSGTNVNTIQTSVSYTAPANVKNLTGTGTADLTLTGGAQTTTITANNGNSTLVAGSAVATLVGGTGNDIFVLNNVRDVVQAKAGSNINTIQTSVSYTAPANVQVLAGTGSAKLTLTGGAQTTTIIGNAGNSTLTAGSGTVTLIGGSGNDTMVGGTGNDTFVVNNVGDVVQAKSGSNINTIQTSVSYTAPANVQVLTGTGSANLTLTGGAQTTTITGNAGNSTLTAGSGTVTLIGGSGNDTMVGGTGNDTFVVNNVGDIVQAKSGTNVNTIQTSVSYTAPANVKNLTGTGSANLTLTGGAQTTTITANNGNSTLVAGSAVATLVGGTGNTTFVINNASDVVQAKAGTNINTILTSVNFVAPANVQFLTATGSSALTLTGSSLVGEVLTANNGGDTLVASTGATALIGGTGADTLRGGNSKDLLIGGKGADTLSTGATSNVIAFNAGDGRDTVLASSGGTNTLSLGGGINYQDLSLAKSGNDLILNNGANDSVTFKSWYSATGNQSVSTLQMIEASSSGYNPSSTNGLLNQKIETFDFAKLVTHFNQALAATPTMTSWGVMNDLLNEHLSGSDTAALGGDLAYQYGMTGNIAALSSAAAQGVLADTNFATRAQAVH